MDAHSGARGWFGVKFSEATAQYEAWLGGHTRLIQRDLDLKHERMRATPFEFLRATFYRWAQIWRGECEEAVRGPEVLSVGDLHIENFGTWRDSEGRLAWGINDFDEACPLPFTCDLIRLATSVRFAGLSCNGKQCAAAILRGYTAGVDAGGHPFVLAEGHPALWSMATARLHNPSAFWGKLRDLPLLKQMPAGARKALVSLMPKDGLRWHVGHRIAGLGSLGRERYTAIADWHGGLIAREAKALSPSACYWAAHRRGKRIFYRQILDRAVRCPDPFLRIEQHWVVRRLAPDCSRIELSAFPKERDEIRLLQAMGWETANVHLGGAKSRDLKAGLARLPHGWLFRAAKKMERAVLADFERYSTR